ncbi:MAG: NAD(P)/FAD-dependent oxidoreductase [Clostridiales bacterium]|nr:NAD(P)/FAD-dependent oxidoreductase [Clostridiales bacterium]
MRIAVIGGGASGLTAAGSAQGADVVIFEHAEKVGKKIYITGKGRCNFTNACDNQTFLQNVVTNAPFLRSALARFTPDDAIELLNRNGCATKIERGRRAFPLSDKASDVTKALWHYAENNGAKLRIGCDVRSIEKTGDMFEIRYYDGTEHVEKFDRVVICTGGVSYSMTGSDGSGYALAEKFGHSIVSPMPSLVELFTDKALTSAEGLTLKNVAVRADGIKPIFGDLMITEKGLSGPIILTLSALAARREFPYKIYIDFKPAMTAEELDTRLLRDFSAQLNKQFKNALDLLLPKSIIPYIIDRLGLASDRQVNSVTKQERRSLIDIIKNFELGVIGNAGYDRAVVTNGGVDVKQVDPKTMQSRLVSGLFFGGEVLNVDALTGGYNFHIALATGYVAGVNAAGATNE